MKYRLKRCSAVWLLRGWILTTGWILFLLLLLSSHLTNGQMISYGMRKLALSMNQFGLDLLRASERSNQTGIALSSGPLSTSSTTTAGLPTSYSFCPFCIGTTLATLLAGLWPGRSSATTNEYDSLRDALYLSNMQPQEIHLAFFDLMRHLQVNMPDGFKSKRSIAEYDYPDRHNQQHTQYSGNSDRSDRDHHSSFSSSSQQNTEHPNTAPIIDSAQSSSNLVHLLETVYVQRYLPVDYNYYVLMQHYYRTPVRSLDFAFAPEESRQHINAVVKQSTDGKIQNLLPADVADDHVDQFDLPLSSSSSSQSHQHQSKPWSSTRLLLLSAIYFRGKLDLRDLTAKRLAKLAQQKVHNRPNHPNNVHRPQSSKPALGPSMSSTTSTSTTTPGPSKEFDPFKPLTNSNKVRTKESIRLRHSHNSYLNATVVEMPFVDGIISLLALVPDNSGPGMNQMVSRLNAQLIVDLVQSLDINRIDISVPSLSIDYSVPNLEQLFSQLGLSGLLLADHRKSFYASEPLLTNFAGIEGFPLSQVTQIHHKTVLDIEILDNDTPAAAPLGPSNQRSRRNIPNDLVSSPVIQVLESEPPPESKWPSNRGFIVRNRHHPQPPIVQHPISHSKARPQPSASLTVTSSIKPPQPPPPKSPTKPISPISQPAIPNIVKRTQISLDQQDFIYLILDNISGLIIAIGKYRAPVN